MENKKKLVIIDFLKQLLDLYEFKIYVTNNSQNEDVFMLKDLQGDNWSYIEQDEFSSLADIMERLNSPHEDYIYRSLEERKDANEKIPIEDWDLTAKRYIESEIVSKILDKVSATEYKTFESYLPSFDTNEIISVLNEEEQFCKTVCQKYINTMSKEMILEKDNKVIHIFVDDDFIPLKEEGKITVNNYQYYLDNDFEIYKYDFYKELFDGTIRNEIAYDLNDLEVFDNNGNWDFYITFEELQKMGYGYIVKDQFPAIEKYIIDDETDFYDYFSLEELKDFEKSLQLYHETDDIDINELGELYSKSNTDFNENIIALSEGSISYDDFISLYKESSPTLFDICLLKVEEYFRENQIQDLMEYGNDR